MSADDLAALCREIADYDLDSLLRDLDVDLDVLLRDLETDTAALLQQLDPGPPPPQ